ncbi:MAG: DUF6326 family protein [Anaerolineales bacterium]|jgi:glucan phosphoethanolaminetransferase (alkaline phosphatase superfamily)
MNTSNNKAMILRDTKIDIKIILSALWVTLMLFYIYADILGFYTPGIIEGVVSGEVGSMPITQGFLFVMAIWMALPSLMVFLSLVLKASANRWVNIITAILSLAVLAATFLVGDISMRYAFQAIVEVLLIVAIIWQAWKWPQQQIVENTP